MLEASYAIVRIIQMFPRIDLPEDEPHPDVGKEKQTQASEAILSYNYTLDSREGRRVKLRREDGEGLELSMFSHPINVLLSTLSTPVLFLSHRPPRISIPLPPHQLASFRIRQNPAHLEYSHFLQP